MQAYLLMRIDAPLLSFGGLRVDQEGVTMDFPGLSLVTGLLGNALGYSHADAPALQALQERIRFGVRRDRLPKRLVDFHTVALGQEQFLGTGWTTRGVREGRGGGSSAGTHIRNQHFLADGVFTLALELVGEGSPNLDDLKRALETPERPLFFGRKTCLPASPILLGVIDAPSLLAALRKAPRLEGSRAAGAPTRVSAWWPEEAEGEPTQGARLLAVGDQRDWRNQVHTGIRYMRHGEITLEEAAV